MGWKTGWQNFFGLLTKYFTISFRVKSKDSMWVKKQFRKQSIGMHRKSSASVNSQPCTRHLFRKRYWLRVSESKELQLLTYVKFEFYVRDGHLDPLAFLESPTLRILYEALKNLSENFSWTHSSGPRPAHR